jgi:hypothetical protein
MPSVADNSGYETHELLSIIFNILKVSPTSGGRSVGIVRSRTQAKEFVDILDDGKDFHS